MTEGSNNKQGWEVDEAYETGVEDPVDAGVMKTSRAFIAGWICFFAAFGGFLLTFGHSVEIGEYGLVGLWRSTFMGGGVFCFFVFMMTIALSAEVTWPLTRRERTIAMIVGTFLGSWAGLALYAYAYASGLTVRNSL